MYHYDFTTASELEIFIARLEEIIQEWRLPQKPLDPPLQKDDFINAEWCFSTETLTFAGTLFDFWMSYLLFAPCKPP